LKLDLSQQYQHDRELYTQAKSHFIQSIFKKISVTT
jgi:hypothetical protein